MFLYYLPVYGGSSGSLIKEGSKLLLICCHLIAIGVTNNPLGLQLSPASQVNSARTCPISHLAVYTLVHEIL